MDDRERELIEANIKLTAEVERLRALIRAAAVAFNQLFDTWNMVDFEKDEQRGQAGVSQGTGGGELDGGVWDRRPR